MQRQTHAPTGFLDTGQLIDGGRIMDGRHIGTDSGTLIPKEHAG